MKSNWLRIILSFFVLSIFTSAHCRTYLVSIGIADYSAFPGKLENLRLTEADAKAIAALYAENTSVDYALLLNQDASRNKILKAIKKVFSKATPDDRVVFFFSGHGYPGGFCASDGKVSYSEVRNAMATSKSNTKLMFIDACRAGGMRVTPEEAQTAVNAAQKANVMLFLSSRNNENSIEHPSMANGLFTAYLLKGLKGGADADRNRIITAKELFKFVHDGVVSISNEKQHPVMWGNFKDNMTIVKW